MRTPGRLISLAISPAGQGAVKRYRTPHCRERRRAGEQDAILARVQPGKQHLPINRAKAFFFARVNKLDPTACVQSTHERNFTTTKWASAVVP